MAEQNNRARADSLIKSLVNMNPPPPPPAAAGGRPLPPKAPPQAPAPATNGGK